MDDEHAWLLEVPCPQCGETGVLAGILWGLPFAPPEGNVILGGCVDPNVDAEHGCRTCDWEGIVDRWGRPKWPTRRARILGCLLGGAIGDALGAPVEFWGSERIARDLPEGLRDYIPSGYGPALGLVTDDTQMTVFTMEALLRCVADPTADPVVELHRSYLEWWDTQCMSEPPAGAALGSLQAETWLYARRAPGTTCSGALAASREQLGMPASNNSKGCGAVMRSAPFGLLPFDEGPELAIAGAALTHAHPTGQIASGALAVIIRSLMGGMTLEDSIDMALSWTRRQPDGEETHAALEAAVALAHSPQSPSQSLVESLGGAWIGEEALGISVYCALAYPGGDQVLDALSLAVCHGGDSDSTGAICGNILGALHGVTALTPHLIEAVEGRAAIERLAMDLGDLLGARLAAS